MSVIHTLTFVCLCFPFPKFNDLATYIFPALPCNFLSNKIVSNVSFSYEYKSADIFLKDFELMKNNAIKFNGVGSAIGIEATAIYEFVKKTIESNREELTKMEEAVRDQMSSGRKRIKTGNGGASPSSQVSTEAVSRDGPPSLPHSMSMANVMLDGIETTVNLGNLEMHAFNFDDVSDSDDSMAMALKASEV